MCIRSICDDISNTLAKNKCFQLEARAGEQFQQADVCVENKVRQDGHCGWAEVGLESG